MDDLIAFVTARLDEDEAAARESYYEGQRWITEEEGVYRWPDDELVHSADRKADARHIARHDPARVLREIAAKRVVLEWYAESVEASALFREKLGTGTHMAVAAESYLNVMRADAAVHSDHPRYRAEWAPPGGG